MRTEGARPVLVRAGLYYAFVGGPAVGNYIGDFMVPTLVGNTVGGVSLVAALNHAQVASRKTKEASARKKAKK